MVENALYGDLVSCFFGLASLMFAWELSTVSFLPWISPSRRCKSEAFHTAEIAWVTDLLQNSFRSSSLP